MDLDRDINNDFLDFDDDDFTEAALQRITEMIASRNEARERESEVAEPLNVKDCKLFISVASLEGIPSTATCLGLIKPTFWCELEIVKVKSNFNLFLNYPEMDCSTNPDPTYVVCTDSSKPAVWDLAEYFGETLVTFKIYRGKLRKSKVVGSRAIRLSELLQKQNEQRSHTQTLSEPVSWSIAHSVLVGTSLFTHKKKAIPATATSTSWLKTAKDASTTLTSTSAGGHVEHRKPLTLSDITRGKSSVNYSPVSTSNGDCERKGATVRVNFSFRLVQLQHCLVANIAARCEQLCPYGGVGGSPGCSPSGTIHVSELHQLAASAPPSIVVDVMRGLSRKHALPQALEVLTSTALSPNNNNITCPPPKPAAAAPVFPRRTGGAQHLLGARGAATTPAGPLADAPNVGWSAFDLALLNRQDATVLEMLQRCGSLCFSNIAAGRGSPLHMAVLGGSVECIEFVGRYIKKFGTRQVSGPGARLWNSSLSAKLEWRDSNDDTALSLACRLPPSAALQSAIVYLLILGADCAAVSAKSNYTPLMHACQSGAARAVRTLLSITKSHQDVMDAILNVGDVNSILNNTTSLDVEPAVREQIQLAIANSAASARSSALAVHLQSNPRSRNILRGQDVGDGGHFNPLSVYMCEPCRRDAVLGRQAAHIAADNGHTEIVCALLEIGVSCAVIDLYGDNLLHIASRRGNTALINKLIESEYKEWEAFHSLVKKGKTLETLLVRPKSLLLKNCAGDSPLDLALENRHFAAFADMLAGAVRIYGSMQLGLLRDYAALLERSFLGTSPETEVTVRTSPIAAAARPLSAEQHMQKCKKLVAALIDGEGLDSRVIAQRSGNVEAITTREVRGEVQVVAGDKEEEKEEKEEKEEEEDGPEDGSGAGTGSGRIIDDEADSIEYLFALTSLGMKYITDNASSASTAPMASSPYNGTSTGAAVGGAAVGGGSGRAPAVEVEV